MKDAPLRKPHRAVAKRRIGPVAAAEPTQALVRADLKAGIDPEQRRAMVAEAAYFCAERRGFEPGHEIEDWLAAESQIDTVLGFGALNQAV
jgi:hypothetical protein